MNTEHPSGDDHELIRKLHHADLRAQVLFQRRGLPQSLLFHPNYRHGRPYTKKCYESCVFTTQGLIS